MAQGFVRMSPGVNDLGKLEDVFRVLFDPHWNENGGTPAAIEFLVNNGGQKTLRSFMCWLIYPNKQVILDGMPEVKQELVETAGDLAFHITSEGWSRLVSFVETSWLRRKIMIASHAIKHGDYQGADSAIHAIQQLTLAALANPSFPNSLLLGLLKVAPLSAGGFNRTWVRDNKPVFLFQLLNAVVVHKESEFLDFVLEKISGEANVLRNKKDTTSHRLELATGIAQFIQRSGSSKTDLSFELYHGLGVWGLYTTMQTVLSWEESYPLAKGLYKALTNCGSQARGRLEEFVRGYLALYVSWHPGAEVTAFETFILGLANRHPGLSSSIVKQTIARERKARSARKRQAIRKEIKLAAIVAD